MIDKIDGIELNVTPASFDEVCDLQEAVAVALKGTGIKLNLSGFTMDIENMGGDIGGIIESVLSLVTNRALREQLFICCKRVTFGKVGVTKEFFDDPDNRKYYYPIMTKVLKVNLSSFFGVLSSALPGGLAGITGFFQKLILKQTSKK